MKKASLYLNFLSILIPLLVLVGWQFDIDFFKRPISGSVFMNPVTAVGIFLSALSLYLAGTENQPKLQITARALAGFVLFFALIKLVTAVLGVELKIQPLLFRQELATELNHKASNITSPNALISIIQFSLALLLFHSRHIRTRRLANYLAMLVLLIGLFSLIGYMYHVKEYYSVPSFYPMAIHTALCFTFLALALLFANNDVGFMVVLSNPNIAGKIARLLVPATVVVPIILGYLWVYAQTYLSITGEFGISILIIGFIAVFFTLIWYVSAALNKGDIARVASENALMQKNQILATTEERLLLATEGTSAGIWDWMDMIKDEQWWSSRFYELLGYRNNEIPSTAKTFREFMHPVDFKGIAKKLDEHFKQKSRFEIEARLMTKSGGYKWFLGTGQVRRNEQGIPVRMVGSIIDIDEQKKTRDLIEQQAALIKMLPDGIVFYSKGMKFADINTGAEKMFDLKRDEVIGKNLGDFINFAMGAGEKFENSIDQLRETGFYRGELQITNKITGKAVNVLVNIKKIENSSGAEPLFMAIYTDLSPLRINEELKRALKSLETNNQYLEQFAYISAHDIKAPIITISGLTELMVKSNAVKDEHLEVLKMLTNSVKQIQRTNHSLNNILKLRKNLMTKDYAADQSFTLRTIFDDVKGSLQHNIELANGTVEVDLHDIGEVHFQYVYVKSVFYNLLSNALKYRDPERALIVKIEAIKVNEKQFCFIIEDNGLGIDLEKNKGKLFGIFKRFHTHVEGSGVGLHIVKSIVDEYNGTIEVQSKPGNGTRFVINFNESILA
jgi:PAS domain S-box-containing protein